MALTETVEYKAQQHGIAAFAVKRYDVILRDGVEISRGNPHTLTVNPGDDISIYPEEIQGMINGYWTDVVTAAYEAQQSASSNKQ